MRTRKGCFGDWLGEALGKRARNAMNITPDLLEAVVLVGGKGTRLRGVVSDRPKPMALVCGRPFLEWLLLALRAQGVTRVVLATGYMADSVEDYFGDGAAWDMELLYSKDPSPLGTGGAVRHAAELADSDHLLALNGDSYCCAEVVRLLQEHLRREAKGTLWLVPKRDCSRYGAVRVGDDGSIAAFLEKSHVHSSGLINAGVYLLDRAVVQAIPCGTTTSLEREVFPRLVGRGLYGVVGNGPFLDIGTPESYARAHQFMAQEAKRWQADAA